MRWLIKCAYICLYIYRYLERNNFRGTIFIRFLDFLSDPRQLLIGCRTLCQIHAEARRRSEKFGTIYWSILKYGTFSHSRVLVLLYQSVPIKTPIKRVDCEKKIWEFFSPHHSCIRNHTQSLRCRNLRRSFQSHGAIRHWSQTGSSFPKQSLRVESKLRPRLSLGCSRPPNWMNLRVKHWIYSIIAIINLWYTLSTLYTIGWQPKKEKSCFLAMAKNDTLTSEVRALNHK